MDRIGIGSDSVIDRWIRWTDHKSNVSLSLRHNDDNEDEKTRRQNEKTKLAKGNTGKKTERKRTGWCVLAY